MRMLGQRRMIRALCFHSLPRAKNMCQATFSSPYQFLLNTLTLRADGYKESREKDSYLGRIYMRTQQYKTK